ncbi:MAG: exodeoxyribonuclease VII large subunit [Rickettsiales bacterium]|nr:exodeoxyribonuclease VII large subunit [Rickettsiales bacterium]
MNFNIPEFTVSEFSRSVKRVVEDAFGYVRIKGEITGFKKASSGHLYFSLKDENSTLSAVCFRNAASLVNFEIGDGLQIIASGKITTFEGRSNYQIIVEKLEIAGIGAILEMIEKRKQKLIAEGLFDEIHKKPIPFFPKIIGVITSETGAVIQDIKHRIEARCPTHIKLYPTLVQGEKAAFEIIKAIKYFNKLKKDERPEVLIIARGGGSFEDLLPFNDEALVREVFASEIPIISAIGHETDTSLIDFVSDLRAPTPTAAAELATPILNDLKNQLNFLNEKLNFLPQKILNEKLQHIKNLQKYLVDPLIILKRIKEKLTSLEKSFFTSFNNLLLRKSQKLSTLQISKENLFSKINILKQQNEYLFKSLNSLLANDLKKRDVNLKNLDKLLKAHHYKEILKRGFALTKDKEGKIISSVSQVKMKEEIVTELSDGEFSSYVINHHPECSKGSHKKKEIVQLELLSS